MKKIIPYIITGNVLLIALSGPVSAQTSTIEGYVRQGADGNPLVQSGATIEISGTGITAIPDQFGYYQFSGIEPGTNVTVILTVTLTDNPESLERTFIVGDGINKMDLWINALSDIDMNSYTAIDLGSQVWMAENLKAVRLNDGTTMNPIDNNMAWQYNETPSYCWYNHEEANKNIYGALYDWYAVNTGLLCPVGWHVPSDAEWTSLTDYAGGELLAGANLKEIGTLHWTGPNPSTNVTGFTARPGGMRTVDGTFFNLNGGAYFWSGTLASSNQVYQRYLGYTMQNVYPSTNQFNTGGSVRCLRNIAMPSLSSFVNEITQVSAQSGGNIISDGGAEITSRGICWSTSSNPTTSSNTIPDANPGTGYFEGSITGLEPGTTYYARAYATNSIGTAYGNEISFRTFNAETISDNDGNTYNTVTIGTQIWMAENLKTTKFNDGTEIPPVTENADWISLSAPGYCFYNNDAGTYKDTYGALYNWYVVDTESNSGQNVCPTGWHVPSYVEWTDLFNYLGGRNVAGGKLKGTGTIEGGDGLWNYPNSGATNETGFTALPGGYRWDIINNGDFGFLGSSGMWWSTTEYETDPNNAFSPQMGFNFSNVSNNNSPKEMGLSVRCIMNSAAHTVTNTNDDGPGSLRNAIEIANSTTGVKETITFNIPGDGPHTIMPLIPLPNITESVIIDGYTQPGSSRAIAGSPAILQIELDGSIIPSDNEWQMGLTLWGGSSTIRGLMINNFGDAGIHIEGRLDQPDVPPCIDNIIEGNYIGVAQDGTLKGNNGGIKIWRSTGNIIGGDNPENRNIISGGPANIWGAGTVGIFILLPESANNTVKGNYIGIGPDGETGLNGSEVGVRINEGAHDNIIGPGNIISGNTLAGIQMEPLDDRNSHSNRIIGNLIGTDKDGTSAVPNGNGIRIFGAINNTIGGDTPEERNIISGNINIGIEINPSELFPGSGNVVTGNYIGLNSQGNSPIGNGSEGIRINSANNRMGGINSGEGNVISGNNIGVNVFGDDADNNIVIGNFIGTNGSGTLPLGNAGSGIEILDGATENIIGGGNLISGNGFAGVVISGQSTNNQVIDNIIGTNITVDALISNGDDGVHISDASENLVSGNILCGAGRNGVGNNGIEILGALASGNIITGNFIGTNSVSTPGLGNGFMGIQIKRDAHHNIIGPGNVISGNLNHGVLIESDSGWEGATSADNNVIKGNYIGTTAEGEDGLGNYMCGIMIQDKASDNIVGPENFISGNIGSAINISGTSTTGNHVIGNYIGTDKSGKNPVPNGHGIAIEDGASENYIGGSAPGLGNLIAFNSNVGIWLGSNSSYVQSNEIVGHSQDGIFIDGSNNTIGGSDPGSRNFLHENNNGIRTGSNADYNTIEGNYLGTDKTGESDQTEGYNGVALSGSYNLVKNNLISGYNNGHGIYIQRWLNPDGPIPEGNRLEGNIIGMNTSETTAIPNQLGISINTAVGTIIYKNVIAGNQYDGIHIEGQFFNEDDDYHYSINNLISQNSFYNNGQLGIDLDLDFVTGNDENDPDEGTNHLQNFPVIESISFSPGVVDISGTLNSESNTEYTVEFFANLVADEIDFEGLHYGEGETYLGSETVTTDDDGNASFAVTFPIKSGDGQVITATATDPDGNTSEFSRAVGGYADQEVGTEWPLHYKYNRLGVENITNGSDITAVINSFQTWSDVPTADVEFLNDGPTDDKYASIDGVNLVSFVDDHFPWAPGILAYAAKTIKMDADGETAQIIDADIIVNPDFVNSLTGTLGVADEGGTPDYYDIQSVITHEIGHLLGLIHTGVVDATMFFWIDDGTTDGRSLEPDDAAWVSYKYPGETYASTYGTLSGDVTYGYDPYPNVAGALVTAENTEGIQFHSYSDADGIFNVPVERNGSYTIHIQPLDGDVNGFPMKPGNISSYIYSNTVYIDYPDEFYSGSDAETSDEETSESKTGIDADPVLVFPSTANISIRTNPDLTPPDIVSITPNDGQPVKVMPDIIITFSEPVEITSLSDETCWLEFGGTKYYGNFTELGGNSDIILFSPNEPLAYSTTYNLYLAEYYDDNTPCITDLKGNGLVSTYSDYSITTVSEDGISPVITGIIPEDEAEGVFVTDKILVFFSEPMNKTSVESGFTVSCTATPDVEGSFSWKNENTLMTFTPAGSLEEDTEYTITFTGTITDLSNIPMGTVVPTTFTTVMAAAPEIVYMEPGNQIETGVSVTTPVVVDFTEPINPSTVNSTTFKLLVGTVPDQVSGTYEFLNDNSRVIFRPDDPLQFETDYTIELTGGIKDVSPVSLNFDPLQVKNQGTVETWIPATFTTATSPTEPDIDYIDPPSGVSGSLVTIGGEGFDPDPADNSVMFGEIPATIKSANLTSLTVEVPKGALSGMVTITTGGSTTDPGYYFYVIPQSLDPCENVLSNTKTGSKSRDVDVTGDGALAYVTNSGSNSVSVIDLTTTPGPTLIQDIVVNIGVSPLKIDINPAGTRAYVTNFGSHTVSVIDLKEGSTKNQVIDVINVGINPYGVAVTPNGDRVYVSNYSSNNLSVIDADPNSGGFDHVVANVNTGTRNRDLAVTGDAGLVLVAGDNGLTIVNSDPADLDYNCVIANSSSGSRTRDVGVSGDAGIAFVTTEEGQLLIIDIFPSSDFFGAVLANVSAGSKARDVKISGDGLHVYVTTENNDVLVYQINPGGAPAAPGSYAGNITLTLHATIPGVGNEGLVIDADNERLLVVNSNTGNDKSEINVIQICCGPITPEKSIGDMIITIQNMISNGKIPRIRGYALIVLLNRSLINIERDRLKLAIVDLRAFISLVKNYIRYKHISADQGNALIDAANAVIAQLKGTKSGEEEYIPDISDQLMDISRDVISESRLGLIFPNPFSESITINFEIAENIVGSEKVQVCIYDVSGRLVGTLVDYKMEPGRYSTIWSGSYDSGGAAPLGTYFVRFRTDTKDEVKQIMLVR